MRGSCENKPNGDLVVGWRIVAGSHAALDDFKCVFHFNLWPLDPAAPHLVVEDANAPSGHEFVPAVADNVCERNKFHLSLVMYGPRVQ